MASQDDKFGHLLQPIRDLASNFNISIANELEQYLEDLEGITFSFQGGKTLNFAEAALLIQGSACVYSKKVEYLHSLVYQALEFVAERKVKAVRSKAAGAVGPDDDDDEFDDEEAFLNLDDTLEEGTNIDLEEDEAGGEDDPLPVRMPSTLLALEDTGVGEGDGETGNYRIASCAVHHSGALLLEARDGFFLDENLQPTDRPATAQAPLVPFGSPAADAAMPMADDFDDGGDDGGYFGGDDGFAPMDDAPAPWEAGAAGEAAAGLPQPQPVALEDAEDDEDEFYDPYTPLDPSDSSSLPCKPYKKMTHIAKRPRAARASRQELPAQALTDGLLSLPAPTSGLLFPEFGYALQQVERAEAKEARGRGQRAVLGPVFSRKEAEALGGQADAEEAEQEEDLFDGVFDGGYDDYDGGAPPGDDDFADIAAAAAEGWAGGPRADLSSEYADLVEAYVAARMAAAEEAAVVTELASRVTNWRVKMAPVLEEEDARPEFDIHVYSERILTGLAELSVEDADAEEGPADVDFGVVVAGAEADNGYDVPRVFSSILQLVNNGNLRITKADDGSDAFSIALLSTEAKQQRIADYKAPSTVDAEAVAEKKGGSGEAEDQPVGAEGVAQREGRAAAKASKRRKA